MFINGHIKLDCKAAFDIQNKSLYSEYNNKQRRKNLVCKIKRKLKKRIQQHEQLQTILNS